MKKYQNFYLKTFRFLVVKFSIYLNRRVFVMVLFGLCVVLWLLAAGFVSVFCPVCCLIDLFGGSCWGRGN